MCVRVCACTRVWPSSSLHTSAERLRTYLIVHVHPKQTLRGALSGIGPHSEECGLRSFRFKRVLTSGCLSSVSTDGIYINAKLSK